MIYSFNLVTTDLKIDESVTRCSPQKDWLILVEFITIADVMMTMIVPFVIISIVNILIALKLTNLKIMRTLKINHRFGVAKCSKGTNKSSTKELDFLSNSNFNKKTFKDFNHNFLSVPTVTTFPARSISLKTSKRLNKPYTNSIKTSLLKKEFSIKYTKNSRNHLNEKIKIEQSFQISTSMNSNKISNETFRKRDKLYSRTTKVVLIISTTFLILHFPIAICKLNSFLKYRKSSSLRFEEKIYNASANSEVLNNFLLNSSRIGFYRNLTIYTNEPEDILDHLVER